VPEVRAAPGSRASRYRKWRPRGGFSRREAAQPDFVLGFILFPETLCVSPSESRTLCVLATGKDEGHELPPD
jgi:hypothetical protein